MQKTDFRMPLSTARIAVPDLTFFTDRQLADALGIGRRTVHRWVDDGILPPPVHFGRLVRWPADDLRKAVERLRAARVRPSRRGRPSRQEEATARRLGITVPALRAQQAGEKK